MFNISLKLVAKACVGAGTIFFCNGIFDAVMAEVSGLTLSDDEKKLAAEINFDTKALYVVKDKTGTGFVKIDINSINNDATGRVIINQLSIPQKKKWIERLEQIKTGYPELNAAIDAEIERTKTSFSPGILNSTQTQEQIRRQEILKEYEPYIRQEFEKVRSKLPAGASVMWNTAMPHLKDNDELLAAMKKQFEGVVLEDKYKSQPGLRFNLPFNSGQVSEEKSLQLRLEGSKSGMTQMPSSAFLGNMPKGICEELNTELNPLGYTVYSGDSIIKEASFYDLDEAKSWLKSFDNKLMYSEITESPPFTFERDFDPKAAKSSMEQFTLPPFSTVSKVSNGKWKITTSTSYTVHTILYNATLVKSDKDPKSKFNTLIGAGTSGCNYAVSNEMIIEKLQKWDELYGIQLHEAKFDSFTISFDKLPDDLSHLCTEMWLFCPDLCEIDHGDYEQKAAIMKDFARKFKDSKKVSFWWD